MSEKTIEVIQDVDLAIKNPYWAEVIQVPHDELFSRFNENDKFTPKCYEIPRQDGEEFRYRNYRDDMVTRYSWAISSPGSLDFITKHLDGRAVVELGAGTGYWAWQLHQRGVKVDAFDKYPPSGKERNFYHSRDDETWRPPEYYPITEGSIEQLTLRDYSDRTLFLCWPPYNNPLGHDAIAAFTGDMIVFIGEGPGGCTGDESMFERLEAEWDLVEVYDDHTQWGGLHDYVFVYRRKP